MEEHGSTGQSPQGAVVPMEEGEGEEEKEEEEEEEKKKKMKKGIVTGQTPYVPST